MAFSDTRKRLANSDGVTPGSLRQMAWISFSGMRRLAANWLASVSWGRPIRHVLVLPLQRAPVEPVVVHAVDEPALVQNEMRYLVSHGEPLARFGIVSRYSTDDTVRPRPSLASPRCPAQGGRGGIPGQGSLANVNTFTGTDRLASAIKSNCSDTLIMRTVLHGCRLTALYNSRSP